MAGALTERDFVTKLDRAGFTEIEIVERTPMGVDDCALYPLFTSDLLDLMRTVIPLQRQQAIGTAIVVRARLDGVRPASRSSAPGAGLRGEAARDR